MGEVKEKVKLDRSLLRIMVGGYLIYLAVKLFKGTAANTGSRTVFILFSVLFAVSGLLCIVRAIYIMAHKRVR